MRRPALAPVPGLPATAQVYEVGPRDGLQNEPVPVALEEKVRFIVGLADAGLSAIEVTSLVRPELVPQLADAERLLEAIEPLRRARSLRLPVLVMNVRGLERALEQGVEEIAVVLSVTESFSRRNAGRSREEALAIVAQVVARARRSGLAVRGYLSMCFGDPWEGDVPASEVVPLALRLLELGCREVSLGDTIGVATPGQVTGLLGALLDVGVASGQLAVHFHDTYGQALANAYAALQCGVATFDTSAGGLGGCPFAKSATGNLATEDLLWMLEGLGIATGVDLERLVDVSARLATVLGRPSPSRAQRVLARREER